MNNPKTLFGRLFYNLDAQLLHNFRVLLFRHSYTLEITFLVLYVLLQIILVIAVHKFNNYVNLIISIFIVLFLFLISLERIILQFKSKQAQKEKDLVQMRYYELKDETSKLRKRNKEILDSFEELILNKNIELKKER